MIRQVDHCVIPNSEITVIIQEQLSITLSFPPANILTRLIIK